MNGCRIDNDIHGRINIFCLLSVEYFSTFTDEPAGELRFLIIRPCDPEAGAQKDVSQTAHTDPADSNKMDPYGVIKINLVHHVLLYSVNIYAGFAGMLIS